MKRCEAMSKVPWIPQGAQRQCHLLATLADHGERHRAGGLEWDEKGNVWMAGKVWNGEDTSKDERATLDAIEVPPPRPGVHPNPHHDNKNDGCSLNDPETFMQSAYSGAFSCSCPNPKASPVPASRYDEDYFEHGPIAGVSGYMNYSWMPERTLRMAHHLIQELPITKGQRVLDFGCAKGFLVKAFRILDVEAWGVDVSEYAIAHADAEVREFCFESDRDPSTLFAWEFKQVDWVIAKDVLEHLTEDELRAFLKTATEFSQRMFVAVPLGNGERFVVPAYDADVTHRLAKPANWWIQTFNTNGWNTVVARNVFPGCKDDWTARYLNGNGFFVLERVD